MNFLLYVKFFSFFNCVLGNYCQKKDSCTSCIKTGPICSWCSELYFKDYRCDYKNSTKCPGSAIEDPKNEVFIIQNEALTSKRVGEEFSVTQIKPQHIRIELRPHSPFDIKISFKQALDYPVDLYYLMDISKTMTKYKDVLENIGESLANEMNKITRNFRLGFGTFIDKIVMPFSDTSPGKLKEPCKGCSMNYGFQNQLKLTTNANEFSDKIRQTPFSGNLDGPEGGLDALMQAIVCTDEIGWRKDARKLLIFATDADFHLAGDGKLAGIIEPNDMRCHLDPFGKYSHSNILDYPSIAQINRKAKENNVLIIFMVTKNKIDLYDELSKHILNSKVKILQKDATSTIDVIVKTYEKITSGVQLIDDLSSKDKKYLNVKYYTKCLETQMIESSSCSGLRVKDNHMVEFLVKITGTDCLERSFNIKPSGLSERVKVDVMMKCDCECEEGTKKKSRYCHDGGYLTCGICECDETHYGDQCECKKDSIDFKLNDINGKCVYKNLTCSNKGVCSCGKCVKCDIGYEGKYCECLKDSCPQSHGSLCGGKIRGKCECGQCICNNGWEGNSCECRTPDFCQYEGKECGGNGRCECGKCECKNDGENVYIGEKCEHCPTCGIKCSDYFGRIRNQILVGENVLKRDDIVSKLVQSLDYTPMGREKSCTVLDENDCQINFYLKYDEEGTLSIDALNRTSCPKPIDVKMTSFSIGGGILATGILALLIWKVITFVHDKKEYAQFLKDVKKPNWQSDQNPIFKPSTATFQNPAFNRSSR